jgi:cobalt-precorrin-5B (C1)-methyltransferase
MMTHAKGSQVDMELLAGIAGECGAAPPAVEEIRGANTARHVSELVAQHGIAGFFDKVCQKVCAACRAHVAGAFTVECLLTDFDGTRLGRYEIAS